MGCCVVMSICCMLQSMCDSILVMLYSGMCHHSVLVDGVVFGCCVLARWFIGWKVWIVTARSGWLGGWNSTVECKSVFDTGEVMAFLSLIYPFNHNVCIGLVISNYKHSIFIKTLISVAYMYIPWSVSLIQDPRLYSWLHGIQLPKLLYHVYNFANIVYVQWSHYSASAN